MPRLLARVPAPVREQKGVVVRIIVTGGAGFIGSALVRQLITETTHQVLVLDKLSYAASLATLEPVRDQSRLHLVQLDLLERAALAQQLAAFAPQAIVHLAAETHVDRSIDDPTPFIDSNIRGTFHLLEATLAYWQTLPPRDQAAFRLLHVSTDEVFGSLGPEGLFREDSPYQPRSPYAASKAAADHLVNAWHHTYGLPTLLTHASNNYGPYQYPEKLIPLVLRRALAGQSLPLYGQGEQVRDWLYVDDHARALRLVLARGTPGERYLIGGHNEHSNRALVETLCDLLDALLPAAPHRPHRQLITFVPDRPGHDHRYALDSSKLRRELGWQPQTSFTQGLAQTVRWYLAHPAWGDPAATVRRGLARSGR
jgi:dTDP-glucose 4,6-dehydratase